MIVQCAACQARFKIADDKVTDRGVKVRCRKCATVFVVHRDSAPAPDAPPLGRVDTGKPRPGMPGPAAAPMPMAPPPAAQFPATSRPQQLVPHPAPAAAKQPPDAFRRFQTKELGADPFLQPQRLARPDPFAGLEEATSPAFSPPPPASAPPQAADPFASLDLGGNPIPTPQQESFGEATIRRDISPALQHLSIPPPQQQQADPFSSATIRKTLPPQALAAARAAAATSQDPFAKLELGGAASAPPPAQPAAASDPFAHIDLSGPPPAPAPAAPASADPFANIDMGSPAGAPMSQGFGNIDFGAPPQAPAAPSFQQGQGFSQAPLSQPTAPPSRPLAPTAASTDPFAGVDVSGMGPAPAAAPSMSMPAPGGLSAPGMPGGLPGSLDLGSIDLSPPEPGFGDEPEAPPPPQPVAPPSADLSEPRTVVKNVKWDGEKVEVKSPAAAYAAQLLTKKAADRPRRSLIASLLMALVFLGVGGLVVERTARAIKEHGATPTTQAGKLSVTDLTSTYYPTREGRPVFIVRGKVTNRTDERQAPSVKVTIELRKGDSVERSADAYAGKVPNLEEIFQTSGPLEVAEAAQRVASQAGPLEPKASAEFLAVFGEFPDDLPDLTIRAVAVASAVPAPPAGKAAAEPARAPGPAKADAAAKPTPSGKGADPGKGPGGAKAVEFPMDDPRRPAKPAQPEPKLVAPKPLADDAKAPEPAKAAPAANKKFEFPMDEPPKRLKVNSGTAPAKAAPAKAP
ncbi:MAG TPA: zinc-ribbon domain-containing protein [Myxococcales bacterium]